MLALSIKPQPRTVRVTFDGETATVTADPALPSDPQPQEFEDLAMARAFAAGVAIGLGSSIEEQWI